MVLLQELRIHRISLVDLSILVVETTEGLLLSRRKKDVGVNPTINIATPQSQSPRHT